MGLGDVRSNGLFFDFDSKKDGLNDHAMRLLAFNLLVSNGFCSWLLCRKYMGDKMKYACFIIYFIIYITACASPQTHYATRPMKPVSQKGQINFTQPTPKPAPKIEYIETNNYYYYCPRGSK